MGVGTGVGGVGGTAVTAGAADGAGSGSSVEVALSDTSLDGSADSGELEPLEHALAIHKITATSASVRKKAFIDFHVMSLTAFGQARGPN